MNNLIIPLSGAAHSGKTTFIEYIKNKYKDNVVLLDEVIRNIKIENIDEIRKNPSEYLDLEINIISAKIDAERQINKKHNNKVIMIDRSLVDSYFYYIFYLDKSQLNENELIRYHDFLRYLLNQTREHVNELYSYIYFMEPINKITRQDEYTQKNLKYTQINEYELMNILTIGFLENTSKLKYFSAIKNYKQMEKFIKDFIK